MIDTEGNEVRRLVDDRRLAGDTKHRFRWDGRDDDGNVVPDGTLPPAGGPAQGGPGARLDQGGAGGHRAAEGAASPRSTPNVVVPGRRPREVRIRYGGPRNKAPEFRVFRTDDDGPPAGRAPLPRRRPRTGVWDGTVRGGGLAPDGNYAFKVRVRDQAGNETEAPGAGPRARRRAAAHGRRRAPR